jgi:hypothetical protein
MASYAMNPIGLCIPASEAFQSPNLNHALHSSSTRVHFSPFILYKLALDLRNVTNKNLFPSARLIRTSLPPPPLSSSAPSLRLVSPKKILRALAVDVNCRALSRSVSDSAQILLSSVPKGRRRPHRFARHGRHVGAPAEC